MAINIDLATALDPLFKLRGVTTEKQQPTARTTQQGGMLDPLSTPAAPMTVAEQNRANIGGLLGRDARPSRIVAQEQALKQGVNTNTSQGLLQAAQIYDRLGDAATSNYYRGLAVKKATEEKATTQLALDAQNLGLESTAAAINAGIGDMNDHIKAIRDERLAQKKGTDKRPARATLAAQSNASPQIVANIMRGKYDSLDDTAFLSMIEGDQAETKAFADQNGKVGIYRENEAGNIFDHTDDTWKDPSEMGLKPAPTVTINQDGMDDITKQFLDGEVDSFTELRQQADDSIDSLARSRTLLAELNEGMNTGLFSDFENGLTALALKFGLIEPGSSEEANRSRTKAYAAEAGQQVANVIKQFGSGTGLSDADREYAANIVAANPESLEEADIRRILNMQIIANYNLIQHHNEVARNMVDNEIIKNVPYAYLEKQSKSEFKMQKMAYNQDRPEAVFYQVTPNTFISRTGENLDVYQKGDTKIVVLPRGDGAWNVNENRMITAEELQQIGQQ